jgi:hypothetical protein
VRQARPSLSVLRTSGIALVGVPRPDGRGYFLLALRASIGDDLSLGSPVKLTCVVNLVGNG